eukprot:3900552-Prymnesium_polylepis.1
MGPAGVCACGVLRLQVHAVTGGGFSQNITRRGSFFLRFPSGDGVCKGCADQCGAPSALCERRCHASLSARHPTTGEQTNTIERASEGRPAGREVTDTQQSDDAAHGPLESEKTVNGHMEAHRRTS